MLLTNHRTTLNKEIGLDLSTMKLSVQRELSHVRITMVHAAGQRLQHDSHIIEKKCTLYILQLFKKNIFCIYVYSGSPPTGLIQHISYPTCSIHGILISIFQSYFCNKLSRKIRNIRLMAEQNKIRRPKEESEVCPTFRTRR